MRRVLSLASASQRFIPKSAVWKRFSSAASESRNLPSEKQQDTSSDESFFENRLEYINSFKHGAYPAISTLKPTITLANFRAEFDHLTPKQKLHEREVIVAGRVMNKRQSSNKLCFFVIESANQSIQVMASEKDYESSSHTSFGDCLLNIKRGDVIAVRGFPAKSGTGELSVVPREMQILTPCLHMLPSHHGIESQEARFRNRYLDLMIDPEVRKTFLARSKAISFLRSFLDTRGFVEVETPVLGTTTGGAMAKPFSTHHNALDLPLKMRISPELYLKQCVIGGLERVYEVGKQFRNEGIDASHNPEFTTCEFYMAYADYDDLFSLTEQLISQMVVAITGSTKVPVRFKSDREEVLVDFAPPFRRLPFVPTLEERMGTKLPDVNDPASIPILEELCRKHNVQLSGPVTLSRLLDKLAGEFIEPLCDQPTFLCDHPLSLSPLAKEHRSIPGVTERFELFVAGKEICNAYSELNDPREQRRRFESQVKEREMGDMEAQEFDENFCRALEYGLPPTAGWGMGIDRMCMLLTRSPHIKEVMLFPLYKPQ